ncbi:MAG: hypothetical protein IJX12_03485 [Lachnospiraceae bacterium]|nr:hypothetical protein [Lachnospiraceae bacterium]
MGLFRKRRYYFTDSSIASDTVIALVMGAIALIIELSGIVASIITAGNTPEIFGTLYLIAIILAVVGEIFAWIGNNAQEGGVLGKRISIGLNIIAMLVIVWILLLGR